MDGVVQWVGLGVSGSRTSRLGRLGFVKHSRRIEGGLRADGFFAPGVKKI